MVCYDVNVSCIQRLEDLCSKETIGDSECHFKEFASKASQSSRHLGHLILAYLEYG